MCADVEAVTHPQHEKYSLKAAYHEAGYDSLITARVLIRLSTKLEALGSYVDVRTTMDQDGDSDDGYTTAQEDANITSLFSNSLSIASGAMANVKNTLLGASSNMNVFPADASTKKKRKNKKKKAVSKTVSRFSQANVFDKLQNLPDDPDGAETEEETLPDTSFAKDTPVPTASVLHPDVITAPKERVPNIPEAPGRTFVPAQLSNRDVKLSTTMPPWKSDFWRIYMNKLRVFGTEEEVCILDAE